ncbi:hypothetical protein C0216_03100 [Streptomyces globosus]|uniref:Sensor domain-containing protein n=1 Tax=Streptomyces globosus TaxID=68209 RepID=A0A344TV88_9ACTN|nr:MULTISPECIES: hypothetical protein [Streptomyces]AXE22559.1 hypothetical protein C0216_03100 [Streptomyces globosus]
MRSTFVRRSVMTASAVSLALLATACGSSDSKGEAKADAPAPAASSAAPAAKGKTDAEMASVIVKQADLPDHLIKEATGAEAALGAAATSDKPECLPLVRAQSLAPVGTATGAARTKVVAKPKEPAANASAEEKVKAAMDALGASATAVTVASYDGKGADDAFAALKAAGTACAGGYTATSAGDTGKISKVSAGTPVTAGDAALAYTVESDADGEKISTQLVVVRKGNTLATFSAVSLKGTAEQPKAVVDAQVKKLG